VRGRLYRGVEELLRAWAMLERRARGGNGGTRAESETDSAAGGG
jgi:hypothetical protein